MRDSPNVKKSTKHCQLFQDPPQKDFFVFGLRSLFGEFHTLPYVTGAALAARSLGATGKAEGRGTKAKPPWGGPPKKEGTKREEVPIRTGRVKWAREKERKLIIVEIPLSHSSSAPGPTLNQSYLHVRRVKEGYIRH